MPSKNCWSNSGAIKIKKIFLALIILSFFVSALALDQTSKLTITSDSNGSASLIVQAVKCVFDGATTEQNCYSARGECKGVPTCTLEIKGVEGEQIEWKSSCGGYAYSTISSNATYAEFTCSTTSTCPTQEQLYDAIRKCKLENRDYKYYTDEQNCSQVKCGEIISVCPESWELEQKIQKCKEANGQVEIVQKESGNLVCKDVECIFPPVPRCYSREELDKQIIECKAKNLDYEFEARDGCNFVKCIDNSSACSSQKIEEQIKQCKDRNLEYTIYLGADGCKYAKCAYPDTNDSENIVQCKKTIRFEYPSCLVSANINGVANCGNRPKQCTAISCTDGFEYDSCKAEETCTRTECKEFIDEQGCKVKKCTDGYTAQSCPTDSDTTTISEGCKVYKDEKGCEIKECTNGYTANNCTSTTPVCKEYKDEKTGCSIKSCTDGRVSESCPNTPSVECKKYTDEQGCTIKSCTDGTTSTDCKQPKDTMSELEARINSLEAVQKKQQGIIEQLLALIGIK